jgi:hypothetical protein
MDMVGIFEFTWVWMFCVIFCSTFVGGQLLHLVTAHSLFQFFSLRLLLAFYSLGIVVKVTEESMSCFGEAVKSLILAVPSKAACFASE